MPEVFPEKIKVGENEYPDLAAMVLNRAIERIKDKQREQQEDEEDVATGDVQ